MPNIEGEVGDFVVVIISGDVSIMEGVVGADG